MLTNVHRYQYQNRNFAALTPHIKMQRLLESVLHDVQCRILLLFTNKLSFATLFIENLDVLHA